MATISNNGLTFIKEREGKYLNEYDDVAGYRTVGYGTLVDGKENFVESVLGRPFTGSVSEDEALKLMKAEVDQNVKTISNSVKVPLTQNQLDALTSFTYNVGEGAFKKSTLLKKLNAGDYNGAANELDRWTFAGGKQIKGLANRRQMEKDLFLTEDEVKYNFFGEQKLDTSVDPTAGEAFTGGFKLESPIESARRNIKAYEHVDSTFDPEFNPIDEITGTELEPFARAFIDAPNREYFEATKKLIAEEVKANQDAQGISGFLGRMAGGLYSPTTLIPGVGLGKLATSTVKNMANAAVRGAALTGLAAGADEMSLLQTQKTRTVEEALANSLGAAAVGGLLFGGVGAFAKNNAKVNVNINREQLAEELQGNFGRSSVGAGQAGATTAAEEGLAGTVGKVISKAGLGKLSPALYNLSTSLSKEAKILTSKLVSHDFLLQKNLTKDLATDVPVESAIEWRHGSRILDYENLDDIYSNFRKAGNKIDKDDFEEIVLNEMWAGNKNPADPNVKAAVKKVDEFIKSRLAKLEEVGVIKKNAFKTAIPGVHIDNLKVHGNYAQFSELVQDAMKRTKPEIAENVAVIRQEAENFIRDILSTRSLELSGLRPKAGPFKGLDLGFTDAELKPFYGTSLRAALDRFSKAYARDISFKETFGDKNMTREIQRVKDEYADLLAKNKGDEAATQRILADQNETLSNLEAMRDRELGVFGVPTDPFSKIDQTAKVIKGLNYLRLGGKMAISQVADMGRLIFHEFVSSTLGKEITGLAKGLRLSKMSKRDLKSMGLYADSYINNNIAMRAGIYDELGGNTALEKAVKKASSIYSRISLLSPFNDFLRGWAANQAVRDTLKLMEKNVAGTISKADKADLRALGFDDFVVKEVIKQVRKHSTAANGELELNLEKWTGEAASVFKSNILRKVNELVVKPGSGDLPKAFSNPVWSSILQFQSFNFAVMNRTLIPSLQRGDLSALARATGQIMLGVVSYMAKKAVDGTVDDIELDPDTLLAEGITRSGILGIALDYPAMAFRTFGVNFSDKYAVRGGDITSLLGPTANAIEDFTGAMDPVINGEKLTRSQIKKLGSLIPGQNLLYWSALTRKAKDYLADKYGKRTRRTRRR